jgi:acetyltransferase-like isoleucine patch superfamily enzyme
VANQIAEESRPVTVPPERMASLGASLRRCYSVSVGLLREGRMAIRRRYQRSAFFMNQKPEYARYEIGDWSYGSPAVMHQDGSGLKIGRFCSISARVTIFLGGDHRCDWVTTYPFSAICPDAQSFQGHPRSKGPVVVGNDVWIGEGATIMSGITIGDGAVIAARSVVTKNVPPYAIVAGSPAQIRKYRFSEEQITALLRIRWWDWPYEQIRAAWPLLLSENLDAFIHTYSTPVTADLPSLAASAQHPT